VGARALFAEDTVRLCSPMPAWGDWLPWATALGSASVAVGAATWRSSRALRILRARPTRWLPGGLPGEEAAAAAAAAAPSTSSARGDAFSADGRLLDVLVKALDVRGRYTSSSDTDMAELLDVDRAPALSAIAARDGAMTELENAAAPGLARIDDEAVMDGLGLPRAPREETFESPPRAGVEYE
jgi:hypothetical protein